MNVTWPNTDHEETQFTAIRELMLTTSVRGEWLTLAEIAAHTEYGEASISAQLRHLRKPHFGGYRVEKRRRHSRLIEGAHASGARDSSPWEYFVRHPQTTIVCGVFEAKKLSSPCQPDDANEGDVSLGTVFRCSLDDSLTPRNGTET